MINGLLIIINRLVFSRYFFAGARPLPSATSSSTICFTKRYIENTAFLNDSISLSSLKCPFYPQRVGMRRARPHL